MGNQYVNKVVLGAETLLDLTSDTATVSDVAKGKTFHLSSGEPATGIAEGGAGGYSVDDFLMAQISGAIEGSTTYIKSYAFNGFLSLTAASFPNCASIAASAFQRCTQLSQISFPLCSVIFSYAFASCSALTSVEFPNCISVYSNAFRNCKSVVTASFPLCRSISDYAFYSCNALVNGFFPSCESIGIYAFYSCSNLETIDIPNCLYIGSAAFSYCINLKSITFTSYIRAIRHSAFFYCFNLSAIYMPNISSVPALANSNVFYSTPIYGYKASTGGYGSIYVPSSLYESFLSDAYWSYYSSRIVSI